MSKFPGACEKTGLRALARHYGIQATYHDIFGSLNEPPAEALLSVLRMLGANTEKMADVGAALRERKQSLWRQAVNPVTVVWDGGPLSLKLRLPIQLAEAPVRYAVALEGGETIDGELADDRRGKPAERKIEGTRYVQRRVCGSERVPFGYHRLHLGIQDLNLDSYLFSAQSQAYRSEDPGEKNWGLFCPLYALTSEKSWGAGSFSDLESFSDFAAGLGAHVVGTLPLFAAFLDEPYNPSPYSPVSRLFWNEFYLDIERIPELAVCSGAKRIISTGFVTELEGLRSGARVDYRRLMALKRRVLEALLQCLLSQPSQRRNEFERFVASHPVAQDYASFRAKVERERKPWELWPAANRDGTLRPDDYDNGARQYHLYVQWLAHEQMHAVSEKNKTRGTALYLDFPLGVNRDGYDVWRERAAFTLDASGGAPPDGFFTKGQNWGFPPLHPEGLRRQGYRYYINCVRHHLQHARMLRIDHIMGLHRFYWVPAGFAPTEGVYVRYPAEEFYAVLSLESHRHRAQIVGENLGTVPPAIDTALARHKIRGMYVGQFGVGVEAEHALDGVPPDSVASLNTHDTPTFAAYWSGADIDDRLELGLLTADQAVQENLSRAQQRTALVGYLQTCGLLGDDPPDAAAVLAAWLSHLARGDSDFLLVNLEDLWLEPLPQNVPGTWMERPNWKRKAHYRLEQLRCMPSVANTLATINQLRNRGEDVALTTTQSLTSPLTDNDLYLFNEGSHFRLYDKLGAHLVNPGGAGGTYFAVWVPDANHVSVIGDFNGWEKGRHCLSPRGQSGIWEGVIPDVGKGTLYKYHIGSRFHGYRVDKADPFSIFNEIPPKFASIVWDLDYQWNDQQWMARRRQHQGLDKPMAIYEMHVGSWRRMVEEGNRSLSYRELATQLADYLHHMGYTHVEFLPVMDHPFFGSWGYQITGYFAPSGNYGTPQDLMYLIDTLHQQGIGVILDWVPSHFPADEHGLAFFDGTHLFEHADPRQGYHPDWNSYIFNYGRKEVQSFLISNALFWLDRYHADGLRVDAVASMLYLDYGRKEGEWVANKYGGRENLEAIEFLRRLNAAVYEHHPDVQTIAEESTSWPMVSRPNYVGGLGFGFKWDMGWMHDTLEYMRQDPIHRRYHHNKLTFRMLYAYHENFVLPLSHDEVVYGKGSLIGKMPGDDWQKFANLRALYGYMYAQPSKKMLFMGGDIAQWREWVHDASLDWDLLDHPAHAGMQKWVRQLNHFYKGEPAMYEWDCDPAGFEWIDCSDAESSVVSLIRKGKSTSTIVLVVCNFTPIPRYSYRIGVPRGGFWQEALNSDAGEYWGSNMGNLGGAEAAPIALHGRSHSLTLILPPLSVSFFRSEM